MKEMFKKGDENRDRVVCCVKMKIRSIKFFSIIVVCEKKLNNLVFLFLIR